MRFIPDRCHDDALDVHVSYISEDRLGVHSFKVTSLSRPGLEHTVTLRVMKSFFKGTPEQALRSGAVRVHSTDEFFQFGGCHYNCSMFSAALYPYFTPPHYPNHDYLCSHTVLAVLDIIMRIGLSEFSSVDETLKFNPNTMHYEAFSSPSPQED